MRWAKRFFGFVESHQSNANRPSDNHLAGFFMARGHVLGLIVIDQHQVTTDGTGDQRGQNLDRHGFKDAAVQAVEPPEDGQCADENAGCPADPGWSVFRDAHAPIIPYLATAGMG
jgi:hypothetical protein